MAVADDFILQACDDFDVRGAADRAIRRSVSDGHARKILRLRAPLVTSNNCGGSGFAHTTIYFRNVSEQRRVRPSAPDHRGPPVSEMSGRAVLGDRPDACDRFAVLPRVRAFVVGRRCRPPRVAKHPDDSSAEDVLGPEHGHSNARPPLVFCQRDDYQSSRRSYCDASQYPTRRPA
jgi:hypothetical protein